MKFIEIIGCEDDCPPVGVIVTVIEEDKLLWAVPVGETITVIEGSPLLPKLRWFYKKGNN